MLSHIHMKPCTFCADSLETGRCPVCHGRGEVLDIIPLLPIIEEDVAITPARRALGVR